MHLIYINANDDWFPHVSRKGRVGRVGRGDRAYTDSQTVQLSVLLC